MISAKEATDLVNIYKTHERKKQSAIAWLEANAEKDIRCAAQEGGTWIIITVPGEQYNWISKVLTEDLGYNVSHVHFCQIQISWGEE